ncbi:glycosyltransferase [bacterium]|nr:glycosyltransferase [bacterium]
MNQGRTIVVNDIAATSAGAYTILVQFLEEISNTAETKAFDWIIFVSCKELMKYNKDNIKIININSKSWLKRILWDLFGLPYWLKRNNINVYSIYSLQNTGIPFVRIKQYIYIHQPLILGKDINLKRFEWKIKLYRYIYYYCVKWTINKRSTIIVQTKWMKEELCKQFKISKNNIVIIKPNINIDFKIKIEEPKKYSYQLFYPAVPIVSYKNHELLIRTLFELRNINSELFSKIKVIFTTKQSFNKLTEYYYSLSKRLNVSDKIEWLGYLNKRQMEEKYLKSDIFLFPSKLESFGLPLIEAAYRKRKVFTLDNSFSRELLDGYSGVNYLKDDPGIWAKQIEIYYNENISRNRIEEKFNMKKHKDTSIINFLMK